MSETGAGPATAVAARLTLAGRLNAVSAEGEVSATVSEGVATMWIATGAEVTDVAAKTATTLT